MAYSDEYLEYLLDQLSLVSDVEAKKMFGGIGLFRNGLMFGMLDGDVFRLKVDDSNRADYEERGMGQFTTKSGKKGMPYWEVPVDVIEDKGTLKEWSDKAYQAAVDAKR